MTSTFTGLGVCGGIGIGRVHLVDRRRITYPRYRVAGDAIEQEVTRFEHALVKSASQFGELQGRAAQAGFRQLDVLLEAHSTILEDEALRGATIRRIRDEGKNAEWALKDTIRSLREVFDQLEFEYFRERRRDVDYVGDRVLRNLLGAEVDLLANLPPESVVVAYDLSPADTVLLAKYAARAFVTEGGGPTSHTAILAHALNIPSVLGARGIMESAGTADEIIVDGDTGIVLLSPSADDLEAYQSRRAEREQVELELRSSRLLPAVTTDGVEIALMGNVEVSSEIEAVLESGGQGVGLYRTEFLTLEAPEVLTAHDHFEVYARLVDALSGRELTIRTMDIGGDKLLRRKSRNARTISGVGALPPTSVNPALGLRAIRLSLRQESDFRAQLRGILMASARGPVRLLLPFVTQVDEIRQARAIIESIMDELAQDRIEFDEHLPVGTMIETPGAALIADLMAKEVDFLSIGTNDLIQYVLAVDRDNDDVTYLYRPCHPAVLRLIRTVLLAGERRGIPVNLCGEMAANPVFTPLLIGLGLRAFSMSATSIPLVKHAIRQLSAEDCRGLAARVLDLPTAEDVEDAMRVAGDAWKHHMLLGGEGLGE